MNLASSGSPGERLGGLLGHLGGILGPSWPSWRASWAVLEASWSHLTRLGGHLGRLGGVLEAILDHLGGFFPVVEVRGSPYGWPAGRAEAHWGSSFGKEPKPKP